MDNGLSFEERKQTENSRVNDIEYSRGGGGGGPTGFFSIKTNVYSKQCYNDPNNPGKMICKEKTNSSGFDPLNKENNYKKTQENVFTHEYKQANENTFEKPSFFEKLSGKLKGIFSEDYENSQQNHMNDPYEDHDFRSNTENRDPMIDEVERMFKNMQNVFIKDIFEDEEDDPIESFFRGMHNNNFQNHRHNHNQYEPFASNNHSFSNHRHQNNFPHRTSREDLFEQDNFHHHQHINVEKPIKYSDSKIYDV